LTFKSIICIALLLSSAGGIVLVIWLARRPPRAGCISTEGLSTDPLVLVASRVVAQPWYGRHNVYAIFLLPKEYRSVWLSARLKVLGAEEPAYLNRDASRIGDRVAVSPGEFAIHTYVPTRIALWSLLTGRFGDLRLPCNWILAVSPLNHAR